MSENSAYIPLSELRELKTLTRSQITRLEGLDSDGKGLLKAEDILQVLENDHKKESQKAFFNRLILLLLVSGVILIGALCGITYGIVATTNELNVDNDDHVLKTSANGDIAGLGAVVSTESAESVLSSTKPWGISRVNFVREDTEEYGFIAINAIQVIENGTALVRSVLGEELILDESGVLVAYGETSGRKLLIFGAIGNAFQSFVEVVIEPLAKTVSDAFKDVFGISLFELLAVLDGANTAVAEVTREGLLDMIDFISPKMGSCVRKFEPTNLDCYTFFPCFDFLRRNFQGQVNACAGRGDKEICLTTAIGGMMNQNEGDILNFIRGLVPALEDCAVKGDFTACVETFSCLSQGRKLL
ncbi:hypothetical protein PSENEW3_00004647 [Picochlorum sp. SENEW3]|nr:hypothetical protein PSENEW3_00004647 [Picochlorum sp. SENEW3]